MSWRFLQMAGQAGKAIQADFDVLILDWSMPGLAVWMFAGSTKRPAAKPRSSC